MKLFTLLFLLLTGAGCSSSQEKPERKVTSFSEDLRGCFLLFDVNTGKYVKKIGDTCEDRFPACSTFKVPLAVMAFDSGILKEEKQELVWDGSKRMLDVWNKNHSAETWLKESVVWFSQRLTPELGKKRLKNYLNKFNYGNEDISTGITSSWLNSPSDPRGSLAINAYEQVDFLTNLWTFNLPVSIRSMELTQKISFLEKSPKGYELSGKTGSNYYDPERKMQFGWFVAHLRKDDQQYIAVTNISDRSPIETKSYGGLRAKEITKEFLANEGLW